MSRTGSPSTPAISVKLKETAAAPSAAEIDLLVSLLPQLLEAMMAAGVQNAGDLNSLTLDKSIQSTEDVAS